MKSAFCICVLFCLVGVHSQKHITIISVHMEYTAYIYISALTDTSYMEYTRRIYHGDFTLGPQFLTELESWYLILTSETSSLLKHLILSRGLPGRYWPISLLSTRRRIRAMGYVETRLTHVISPTTPYKCSIRTLSAHFHNLS